MYVCIRQLALLGTQYFRLLENIPCICSQKTFYNFYFNFKVFPLFRLHIKFSTLFSLRAFFSCCVVATCLLVQSLVYLFHFIDAHFSRCQSYFFNDEFKNSNNKHKWYTKVKYITIAAMNEINKTNNFHTFHAKKEKEKEQRTNKYKQKNSEI